MAEKKHFTDLKPGNILYAVYHKDYDTPKSKYVLVKCKIIENHPYDKKIDISDRYEDPEYRIEHVNWIEIKANNINATYERDYSQFVNEKGYMLIYGLFTDRDAPGLILFACKEDAIEYITESLDRDIKILEKRITKDSGELKRLQKQRKAYDKV